MNDMLICRRCVDAIRSRGEQIYVRPISFEDEIEEPCRCEWREEEYTDSEMVIAEF